MSTALADARRLVEIGACRLKPARAPISTPR